MKIVRSAALLIIIIILFSFSIFNMHTVQLSFFAWRSPELPLFLVLLFAFALGCAAAALWGALRIAGHNRAVKKAAAQEKKKGGDARHKAKGKSTGPTKEEDPEKLEEEGR